MKSSFSTLPNEAKVWMYQAGRKLTMEELDRVRAASNLFLEDWESHGIPVQGAVDVLQNLFIRIAAFTDEDAMCGRAQDAQVRLIKSLEGELGIELTNRMVLAFGEEGRECVVRMHQLDDFIQSGKVGATSLFYNNLVLSKAEFQSSWKTSAQQSWLAGYF